MTTPTPDRPYRRRVLVNTAAVGAANGWSMVLALVSLPLMLRGLGSAAFGTWVLLQTFSAMNGWLSLMDLGMATAGTREIAGRHGVDDRPGLAEAVGSTLASVGLLAVATGLAFAAIGPFVLPALFSAPDDLRGPLQLAIVVYGIQATFDLLIGAFTSVLDGYQRVDRARAVDVARRTLVTAATAVAALATNRLTVVAVASLAATVAGTVVALLATRATIRGLRPRPSTSGARALFRYGRTIAVLRPLGVLRSTIDRFVVGVILGPSAVTLVEVATQVHNGSNAVLSASSYAVVPAAARLHAQGEPTKLTELVESGTRYSLLATWPIAALSAVLAAPLIDVWVGADYAEAAPLIALACAAVAITAPAQVGSQFLLGTGRARTILRIAFAAIVVNVVASIVLVRTVGVAGAFEATILGALVTAPLMIAAVLDDLRLGIATFVRTAIVPAVPAAVGAIAGAGLALALPLGSLATIVVGGVVGLACASLAALRWGLRPHERAKVLSVLRARRPGRPRPDLPASPT
jgi:O-antigen/teichoic acid export membrane protein